MVLGKAGGFFVFFFFVFVDCGEYVVVSMTVCKFCFGDLDRCWSWSECGQKLK